MKIMNNDEFTSEGDFIRPETDGMPQTSGTDTVYTGVSDPAPSFIMDGGQDPDASIEMSGADFSDSEAGGSDWTSMEFFKDFTITEIRNRAVKAQKGRLANAWPKALLYCFLAALLPVVPAAVGIFMSMSGSLVSAGLVIAGLLLMIIIGGPLSWGITAGGLDISREKKFTVKRLFFAFADGHYFKALGSFVILMIISMGISWIGTLPSALVELLSSGLDHGFAYMATQVLACLLYIAGMVLAVQVILKFSMMLPLLVDHPDMKIFQALKLSLKATAGCSWRLFFLMLSYIGWVVLPVIISAAVLAVLAVGGYAYAYMVSRSGDVYQALLIFYVMIFVLMALAYVLMIISASTFIMRLQTALGTFYNALTGWKAEEEEIPDYTENETLNPEDLPAEFENESKSMAESPVDSEMAFEKSENSNDVQ